MRHTDQPSLLRRVFSLLMDTIFIKVLYELFRIIVFVFMGKDKQEYLEILLFMISFIILLILLPLLFKKKRTLGMQLLNLSIKDKNGNIAKSSRIILHNLFVGVWIILAPNIVVMIGNHRIIVLLQLMILGLFLVTFIVSIKNMKITYFWEDIFDTYSKVYSLNI